jgi:hypothetical protein
MTTQPAVDSFGYVYVPIALIPEMEKYSLETYFANRNRFRKFQTPRNLLYEQIVSLHDDIMSILAIIIGFVAFLLARTCYLANLIYRREQTITLLLITV